MRGTRHPPTPPARALDGPRPAAIARSAAGAAAVVFALQALLWLDPRWATVDHEEGLTAAQAAIGTWAGVGPAALLQYKPFCGGCTVDAVLGTLGMTALGPHLAVYKAVPASIAALCAGVVFASVAAQAGRRAAWWVTAALCAVPPVVFEGTARGYGNHAEAGWAAVACLALVSTVTRVPAAAALGLVAAMLATTTLSAAWVTVAVVGVLAARGPGGRWAPAASAAATALAWGLGWYALGGGTDTLAALRTYAEGLPAEIGGRTQVGPWSWSAVTAGLGPFAVPEAAGLGAGALVAVGLSAALATARIRRDPLARAVVAGLVAVTASWSVAPVGLPASVGDAYAGRYLIGPALVGALAVGVAAARAARWRPVVAALLLAVWAAPGAVERGALLGQGASSALVTGRLAPWEQVRRTLLVRRGAGAGTWRCGDDATCRHLDGFRRGQAMGSARCRWVDPPDGADAVTVQGWGLGVAHGLGACQRAPDVCGRFTAACAALPVPQRDVPALRLAVAWGAGDSGSAVGACATADPLAGWLAASAPPVLPLRLPAQLADLADQVAWARLAGADLAARFGTPQPWTGPDVPAAVRLAFETGTAPEGFTVP